MRLPILLISTLLLALTSCSNNEPRCYEAYDTWMVTTLVGNNSSKITSIMIKGYNRDQAGDTLLYSRTETSAVRCVLPLSLNNDSTGFVTVVNGISTIFWVRHTMDMRLVSENCGFAPYYKLTGKRHSAGIDSIRVSDPSVDPKSSERYTTNGQNITVHLRLAN